MTSRFNIYVWLLSCLILPSSIIPGIPNSGYRRRWRMNTKRNILHCKIIQKLVIPSVGVIIWYHKGKYWEHLDYKLMKYKLDEMALVKAIKWAACNFETSLTPMLFNVMTWVILIIFKREGILHTLNTWIISR